MNEDQSPPPGQAPLGYVFRPSLLGASFELRLAPQALHWRSGGRAGEIAYADIHRVRMSFRPVTMQTYRFMTELWSERGPKLEIVSTSWKSMFEQERLDRSYAAFVAELHRRIAAAGSPARFESGSNRLNYWIGAVLFAVCSFGLAALVVRAIQIQAWGGGAFVGGFLLLFLWQAGAYFRRNRPGAYRPDSLPVDLLPAATP